MRQPEGLADRKQQIKLIVAIVLFAAAGGYAWYSLRGDEATEFASLRVYICSETGKPFEHEVSLGELEPVESPHSGKRTGYEAERCYWFKDADGTYKAKTKPTYVLLKKRVDPETTEKTYCPDCGKEVVGHNPKPPDELMKAAEKEGR